MAVDVKERHNSYTRGNRFTTIGIKKLYPTLGPKIEGIKEAISSEKQLDKLWQIVGEAQPLPLSTSFGLWYDADSTCLWLMFYDSTLS
ncbi:hypothetical protein IG631_06911 [Alternaria alternata]|nr:hypothetical protein IG631_06911 [Alternaria alternata]